jgi:large subunit ribosomal protein L24
MPVPVGKVMFVCPKCNKPTRVGYKFDEAGKKFRACKKCGAFVEETVASKR